MGVRITGVETFDVRFPTSRELDGSDAVHVDPDYSLAYCVLRTDGAHSGHGFTFTVGRGNDLCVAAVGILAEKLVGLKMEEVRGDMASLVRLLTGDGQLRWLGPEKGVVHMAAAALLNAVWDLWAREAGKPLWLLLSEMSPSELVACIDFTYIEDALTPAQALEMLERAEPGRRERIEQLRAEGFPAYTTSVGWLGYSDQKVRRLVSAALAEGWSALKLKVGAEPEQDRRRVAMVREAVGPYVRLMIDANQAWGVQEAIERTNALADLQPWWVEEPTCPDDVLGHARIAEAVAPIRVASGEHAMNRVIFKQMLQAGALGVCQIDACRVAGVNENLAILLLAARFGVPVCPHAGGVGLCEVVQHLSYFDYVAVGACRQERMIEFADHLHEHFVTPVDVRAGRYHPPSAPGMGAELREQALREHLYPQGAAWSDDAR